jgi:hypothetical protein
MSGLTEDVHYAARKTMQAPGFSAAVILTVMPVKKGLIRPRILQRDGFGARPERQDGSRISLGGVVEGGLEGGLEGGAMITSKKVEASWSDGPASLKNGIDLLADHMVFWHIALVRDNHHRRLSWC